MMEKIRELRELTGAGVMDAKKALEEAKGNVEKAVEIIREKGIAKAEKKSDRATANGRVHAYIHNTGKVGALVEVACETDFVASNEEFVAMCKEIGMQVASMNPKTVEELMAQSYIRDSSKTIEQMIKTLIGKTGENMKVVRFTRFELGVTEEE